MVLHTRHHHQNNTHSQKLLDQHAGQVVLQVQRALPATTAGPLHRRPQPQEILKTKPTCIPKPNPLTKHRALPHPSTCIPSKYKSHIPVPHLQQPSQPKPLPWPGTTAGMVYDLLHHLASLNDHPLRQTGTPVSQLSLNHTLTSSPESGKPNQCVSPTATQCLSSKPEVSVLILPAPDVKSSVSPSGSTLSNMSSLTSTDSNCESLACQALVRSDCHLGPWLPITYNETTLRHLSGRSQVQIFNTLSLPL